VAPYDVKRELKSLYAPRNTAWALIDVPAQQFVAIDGAGDPNTSPTYADSVQALYAVAYTLKFAAKRDGRDLVVAPLEALWWSDDPEAFINRAKQTWKWTLLINQPDWIVPEAIDEARDTALANKKLPLVADVRRHTLREGRCAQVLHHGSYDDEGPILADLHERYLAAEGLRMVGLHHEIYLNDARRTDPAKLKTVLRQPVRPDD
jgi:hypothetical protein